MEKLFCRFCEKKTAIVYQADNDYQVICSCGCHSPIRHSVNKAVHCWTLLHGTKRKRD